MLSYITANSQGQFLAPKMTVFLYYSPISKGRKIALITVPSLF